MDMILWTFINIQIYISLFRARDVMGSNSASSCDWMGRLRGLQESTRWLHAIKQLIPGYILFPQKYLKIMILG